MKCCPQFLPQPIPEKSCSLPQLCPHPVVWTLDFKCGRGMKWGFVPCSMGWCRGSGCKRDCVSFGSGSRGRTLATSREHPPPSRLRFAHAAIGPPPQRRTGSSPRSPPGSRRLFSESDTRLDRFPATLNRYTVTTLHISSRRPQAPRELERYCPHRPFEQKKCGRGERNVRRETVGKAAKLGFAGGAAYRVGNVGNRLERLGVFLHGGCDLFIGVHDRRVVPTPESGSDLGK